VKPLAAPAVARDLLSGLLGATAPEAIAILERYAGWLSGPGIERGLLGPREVERIWTRHLINSALLVPLLPTSGSVCDLGSGAGLPGVVVAAARPDTSVVLLEPLLRRTTFLTEVAADLGLANVQVVRDRAEQYGALAPGHDVVVARAVAPMATLLEWAMPLLKPGGQLLALKGESAADELAAAKSVLDRLEVGDREVLTLGEGGNVTHAVRVVRPRQMVEQSPRAPQHASPTTPQHTATED
jgi:16S rRNA (guanine527-N7)-methyltransferase